MVENEELVVSLNEDSENEFGVSLDDGESETLTVSLTEEAEDPFEVSLTESEEEPFEVDLTEEEPDEITVKMMSFESLAEQAEEAKTDAEGILQQVIEAGEDACGDIEDARGKAVTSVRNAATEIKRQAAKIVETEARSYDNKREIGYISGLLAECVNSGYVEDGVAYFTHDGEVLFEITGIGGGGGGGGGGSSGNTAVITFTSTTGWASKSYAKDTDVILSFNWSSIEDGNPTGDGTMTVTVNNTNKAAINVQQGDVEINIRNYLSAGENKVKITLMDSYGNTRPKVFTVTVVDMSLKSSFDPNVIQTGDILFQFTPYGGDIEKTVHFVVDGAEIDSLVTTASGREQSYTLDAVRHGAHSLLVYFTAELNGSEFTSNELYYEFISITSGNNTPIIASSFNPGTIQQYTTVSIPFMVYDPTSQTADVMVKVGQDTVGTLTGLDRTAHSYSYRFDTTGRKTISLISGNARKDIILTVTEAAIEVQAETQNLALYLSSAGRNNAESNPAVWTYGEGAGQIAAVFTDFNWVSDGWQEDEDHVVALRVSGDGRVTIPYQIFAEAFNSTGKTIEIEFATRDVRNYSATILSCMNGGRGIQMSAQECGFYSQSAELTMQFKENEHIRIAFVVDKQNDLRLLRCYINGIFSGATRYPYNNDFTQATPAGITIGGTGCTVDVYCIRVYDTNLSSQQIEENWIADTPDGATLLARYSHNNVRDAYGNIQLSKLPGDLPYLVLSAPELPQFKGDKKSCDGYYVDPLNQAKNFNFEGAQIDVQGTSSQYYYRKNYKVKYKGGIINSNGVDIKKYAMRSDSIPVSTFCYKADVASSEGANNVELARLYNDTCPYQTPAQVEDSRVRQGIDGFPIVIFWNNTDTGTTSFLGKYNFNNDKGTEEVFGFVEGDESWETKNHDGSRVTFKGADFSDDAWLNDFEARYPDTDPAYTDCAQLEEFVAWVVSTDPTKATGNALAESVIYGGTTYTTDTAAYRKAKFKAELGDYCEVDSALYFYLFTELFLLVDNRAKNMFLSFMGTPIAAEEEVGE